MHVCVLAAGTRRSKNRKDARVAHDACGWRQPLERSPMSSDNNSCYSDGHVIRSMSIHEVVLKMTINLVPVLWCE
ncbi:hypothetical protein P692DRAFT_20836053 [Suillus brevipes Sb2]|nr:hypothetical protein P692DRAFT_20836053 [Suillus brevipes Sb2]